MRWFALGWTFAESVINVATGHYIAGAIWGVALVAVIALVYHRKETK